MSNRAARRQAARQRSQQRAERPLRAVPERALASPDRPREVAPRPQLDPLEVVRRRYASVLRAEAAEAEAVAAARAAGVSWAALGEVRGITRAGARKRWTEAG